MPKKKGRLFEPIDLGFDIKFEPLIPPKEKSCQSDFAGDISSMVRQSKKDYEDVKKAAELMKSDWAPIVRKMIAKIRRTKIVTGFSKPRRV